MRIATSSIGFLKLLISGVVLVFLISGCKNNNENLLFEMPYQVEFEIPAGLNTIDQHIFEVNNIPTNVDSIFSFYGYDKESIFRIDPGIATMSTIFSNSNYGFIEEAAIEIFNEDDNRGKEVYFRIQIPRNIGSQMDLAATLVDAQEFLKQDRFNFRLILDTRELNNEFIDTRITFNFRVLGE